MNDLWIEFNQENYRCHYYYDTDDDIDVVEIFDEEGDFIDSVWELEMPEDCEVEKYDYFYERITDVIIMSIFMKESQT